MNSFFDYLWFIGTGGYAVSTLIFLKEFLRTLGVKDGIGLVYLRTITFCLFLGSTVLLSVRLLVQYGGLRRDVSVAINTFNPILLCGLGLYLNYLFRAKQRNK